MPEVLSVREKTKPMGRKQGRTTVMVRVYPETAELINGLAAFVRSSAADACEKHLNSSIQKITDDLFDAEYKKRQESKKSGKS